MSEKIKFNNFDHAVSAYFGLLDSYNNVRTHLLSECKNHKETQSELTDLKAKYQKAVEGLKFYADGEGEVLDWDRVNKQGCEQDRGWFARQTLAELGEKE